VRQAGKLGESCPVFFYGGAPGIAQKAAQIWQQQLPELALAGIEDGYLSPEAEQELKVTLKTKQPRLILVGLGVPRQELWIAQHRYLCPDAIWIGVGGSFDIWAGVKSRAPVWLRDNHLEWLYRLYQEPWRWRRMMALPQFALKAIGQRLA
jgi:N-acetylglucosaminyldiphosphoundecaprenol N-acetyl-beta-D-mannosaminyltransferase